uniref:ShKT domain-containing protein n=2 Tax=Emiliania huxleyi TaxID=2903 RepID=A0A7S3SW33_EMIHU
MLRDYDKEETGPNLPAMQMNGNIVGTREAIVKLNLLAAIGMEMLRLQQVKSLAVSITLTGNATSLIAAAITLGTRTMGLVKATFGVARVTKITETMVVFHTLEPNLAIMINERKATLKLMDPATGAVLESTFLCSSSVDCGALHVKGSEEEELVEKAEVALAAAAERRRLNPDTSPRKLSETCMDPSADDPEAWDCECGEEMRLYCEQAGNIEECYRRVICCGGPDWNLCQEWKDAHCGAYPDCMHSPPPAAPAGRRALYSTEPAGDRFDEEPAECADSPVEIISSEVERLGFPAASSCSEMLSIGACDHDLVKHHLCAKTCGGCDVESDGQAASRRRLGKCSQ